MPKLAVLGHPVAHSRSPAMQIAALRELGLEDEWSYDAIDVAPEDFERRVRALSDQGLAGANVTVPHKLAALALADRASDAARAIGAANTLKFTARGIEAENTDAGGLIAALAEPLRGRRALVLGAGGSARACSWALREGGASVSIWNRTPSRARELAREFDLAVVEPLSEGEPLPTRGFELIVNCTTVGLAEANDPDRSVGAEPPDLKPLPVVADGLEADQVVVDLVYGPSPTPLAAAARARGARLVDGIEVLVHQGAASLRLWTGLDPPIDVMRDAARAF